MEDAGGTSNISESEDMSNPSNSTERPELRRTPRREVWWLDLGGKNQSLESIKRRFEDRLDRFLSSSSNSLLCRITSLAPMDSKQIHNLHQCPGYLREEITLASDVSKSVIVSHAFPSQSEVCLICGQLVQYNRTEPSIVDSEKLEDSHYPSQNNIQNMVSLSPLSTSMDASNISEIHSQDSELSFSGDDIQMQDLPNPLNEYEPLDYDAPNQSSSLMFTNDSDYMRLLADAPMSRRAAAAAASVTIANMVASENGTAYMPQMMPSAATVPQPTSTITSKEKKPKGLFKPPAYPTSVLRPRAAPTPSTANTDASVDNEAPRSSSSAAAPVSSFGFDSKNAKILTARRVKELEREAKEKEFVDEQHPNYIDGFWHCSNCGCPESIAIGRRKGPLGDKSQCGTCGTFSFFTHFRLLSVLIMTKIWKAGRSSSKNCDIRQIYQR